MRFSIHGQEFEIKQPGLHNVLNTLAVIAMLHVMGYGLKEISQACAPFGGIERRFDLHLDMPDKSDEPNKSDKHPLVIDDYAHNPHKIAALMATMAGLSGSACYIFQPHGFGPLRLMLKEYAATFNSMLREGDRLFILPVYYTGGTAVRDISSGDLAKLCNASAPVDRDSLIETIGRLPAYASYVVLGGRDETLGELADSIARQVGSRIKA